MSVDQNTTTDNSVIDNSVRNNYDNSVNNSRNNYSDNGNDHNNGAGNDGNSGNSSGNSGSFNDDNDHNTNYGNDYSDNSHDNVDLTYISSDIYNITNIINFITQYYDEDHEPLVSDTESNNPMLSEWHDKDSLSLSYLLPKQEDDYSVNVYATNTKGDTFYMDGTGNFSSSPNDALTFTGLDGDELYFGSLFNDQGGHYAALDISNVAADTYTMHVDISVGGGHIADHTETIDIVIL